MLDVHLTSDTVVPGSTVPGRVAFRHGGVGRNIVECLGRLRERPLFVSAVGNDAAGREILRALRSLDLSTRGVRVCDGRTTSVVACSFDGGAVLRRSMHGQRMPTTWASFGSSRASSETPLKLVNHALGHSGFASIERNSRACAER